MEQTGEFDVIVVGAGIAGLYLIHKLKRIGFSIRAFESASGIGGTWHWNRYPGARCDVDSIFYSYQFDEKLQQEWEWTERYASQPEILRYLNFVADRFDLRKHIQLNTRIRSARYREFEKKWYLESEEGNIISATSTPMALLR